MVIGYIRASATLPTLTAQKEHLQKAGCEKILEEQLGNTPKERPQLTALLQAVKPKDTLVAWSLASLCHSISHLIEVLTVLSQKQVYLIVLQEGIDTTKENSIYSLFEKLAQLEKELKKEKAGTGLKSAKARGRKGGRKKGLSQEAEHKAILAESYYKQGKLGVDEIAQKLKIAKSTLYRYLRHQGIDIRS